MSTISSLYNQKVDIINNSDYDRQVKNLKKEVLDKELDINSLKENPLLSIQSKTDVLFVNLNKHHLFKENSFDNKDSFSKKVIYYQLLNILDLSCSHELLEERIITKGLNKNNDDPVIYCAFHYGSYFHIFHTLIENNIKFSFVIIDKERGKNILLQQKQSHIDKSSKSDKLRHYPKVIGAESLDNALEIYNTLQKKESIIIFIDTFLKEIDKKDKRNKKITFLDNDILLRSGIPDISKKLKVPIIPVIAERTEDNFTQINFHKPVCNTNYQDSNYEINAFQECFDVFSKYVKKHPEQWDQWQYLQNSLVIPPQALKKLPIKSLKGKNLTISFNQNLYKLISKEKDKYLLKINDYQSFKLSDVLFSILDKISKLNYALPDVKTVLGSSLFSDLVEKQVLIINTNDN